MPFAKDLQVTASATDYHLSKETRSRASKAIQGDIPPKLDKDLVESLPVNSNGSLHPPTIFEEILSSKLPSKEKSAKRISEECVVIISAGSETVARTLTCSTFHLLDNPDALRSLKKELLGAMPDGSDTPDLRDLEKLPFLVNGLTPACITGRIADTTSCDRRQLSKNHCVWLASLRLDCRLYLQMCLFGMENGSFRPV